MNARKTRMGAADARRSSPSPRLEAASANPRIENYYRWDEPDANLTVLLDPETIDRLQAAALSRGGSSALSGEESGGLLLGRIEPAEGRTWIVVEGHEPMALDCRNNAASFAAANSLRNRRVVGYYRSHKRKGLFLSAEDLALIHREFRAPENVFLLIKPLPNGACTAGLFFWNDGRIQSESTSSEIPLIPIDASSVESDAPPAPAPILAATAAIPRAATPLAPPAAVNPRRIAIYSVTGLAVVAAAAVLTYRSPRAGGAADGPRVLREAPRTPRLPAQVHRRAEPPAPAAAPAIPIPSGPANASARGELAPHLNAAPTATKTASRTSRQFVPPSADSPAMTAAPDAAVEAPVPAPGSILPGLPQILKPVMEDFAPAPPSRPTAASTTTPPPKSVDAAAGSGSAVTVARTFTPPRVIHEATPAVPRGVGPKITSEAVVTVEVKVDAKGRVAGARVASTKGAAADLLTIEALKAAGLFRFQPAEENGRAVPASTILTFRFAPPDK